MKERKKSIVIGGSFAGLIASRILSDFFGNVILIEKDFFPVSLEGRKGTPQANHIHILLAKGKQILMDYFPNLEKKLLENGANKIDFLEDGKFLLATGWAKRFNSGITTFTCTRNLLEKTLRDEIKIIPNIEIIQGTQVTGLISDPSNTRVLGVRCTTSDKKFELKADLIVDASGRKTNTPNWLEEIGYKKPEELRVDSYVGYATRKYLPPKDFHKKWRMLVILNQPPNNPRAGLIYPIEKNQWLVGLSGIGKNYPPTDEKGFLEFTKKLANSEIYEILKNSKPISDIYGYRIEGSRQYQYEKLNSWPENFIVLGDAVSIFNPFYGQGITSAALGAQTLHKLLPKFKQNSLQGFSKTFQKELAKKTSLPWILGTSEDFRWPTTMGKKPSSLTRFIQNYAEKVMLLGPKSNLATKTFLEMMHMVKSPIVLFHPLIFLKLLSAKFEQNTQSK